MSINITTLFTDLGKVAGAVRNLDGLLGTSAPSPPSAWGSGGPSIKIHNTAVYDIFARFASDNQHLTEGLYAARDDYRTAHENFRTFLRDLFQNIIEHADDDVTLTTKGLETALKEVIEQMESGSKPVDEPTISVTPTVHGLLIGGIPWAFHLSGDVTSREEVIELITQHAPYIQDRKHIMDWIARSKQRATDFAQKLVDLNGSVIKLDTGMQSLIELLRDV